ncbi:MAG TPA: AAA family ATPase, partial [Candidatus Micrarchaeota archaeon]|nr:AAA family ATPase [Candidatus Micrarchaeota archaeon]
MQQAAQKYQDINSFDVRIRSNLAYIQKNESVGPALLVFFGALFLLSTFQFYPLPVVLLLAAICGAVAYKFPPFGVALGVLIALPSVAYQSPVFGWVYFLVIAVTLFESFNTDPAKQNWHIVALLEIIILAPFAPCPLSALSGFVVLAMAISALMVGSSKSLTVSVPAIFFVMLLSSIWVVGNNGFIPVNTGLYDKADFLASNSRPVVGIGDMAPSAVGAVMSLFSFDNAQYVSPALEKILINVGTLLIRDAAVFNLLSWVIILYAIGFVPGMADFRKSKYKQSMAGLALLLVIVNNVAVSMIYGVAFDILVVPYVLVSIAVLYAFDHYGVSLTREQSIQRAKKTSQFGKFGLQDMASSEGAASLDDVGGYEDVKKELREAIVTPLENKELAFEYGIKPSKGILFFGPPGTGKTMMMKALAKEVNYPFYYVKSSDLLSQWYGESEKNISEIFNIARKQAPCILFFDEIDSIGKRRDSYQNDDVAPRIMSLFLQELDGFASKQEIIVIGATNIPNQLDPALMRPGRFDKIIYMPLPDLEARKAIFKVHLKNVPIEPGIDFAALAGKTSRFSGADLKNVCSEAIRMAASEAGVAKKTVPVSMRHILAVISAVKPSTSLEALETYEKFRLDFERRSGKIGVVEEKKEEAVKWSDVIGLDHVREALKEAIEIPLLHEDLMKQYKIKPSKGLLLFGPPGTGKTMIIKAAANELKATFLSLSGAELMKNGPNYAQVTLKET